MLGEQLGSYLVTGQLGEGGMGTVYAAQHVLLGRRAALKVLLPAFSSHQDMIERFFNEARATAAIRHPGIVEIYDFGYHTDGSAYIAMELLPGHSLALRIARGRAPITDALQIARQIAAALQAAHEAGIIHRDLKPDNVFVVSDAELGLRIKLLDFGIAKLAGGTLALRKTQTGALIGTPAYMAPEQCRGVAVDHRADIYALGCILFELLTGRPPFEGEGAGDLLAAHITRPPPAPSQLAPDVPPAIDALVLRLLAKDPAGRPASARDVFIDLDLALAGSQTPPRTWPGTATASAATIAMTTTLSGAAAEVRTSTASGTDRSTDGRTGSSTGVASITGSGTNPGTRTRTRTPRSSWGWRGVGFVAGTLVLALAGGGVWLSRGNAATPSAGPASAPPASPTWAIPIVSQPDKAAPAAATASRSDTAQPDTEKEPDTAGTKPDMAETKPDMAGTKPDMAGTNPDMAGTNPDKRKVAEGAQPSGSDAPKPQHPRSGPSRARERRQTPAPAPAREPSPDRSINPFEDAR